MIGLELVMTIARAGRAFFVCKVLRWVDVSAEKRMRKTIPGFSLDLGVLGSTFVNALFP